MPTTYVRGNIFESPAETLVNTVNTVGVMGKGIAYEFKRLYPEMFREYRDLCERGSLQIGALYLYRTDHKSVLNFPTKKHWRSPSQPEYIEEGLKTFVRTYRERRHSFGRVSSTRMRAWWARLRVPGEADHGEMAQTSGMPCLYLSASTGLPDP